MPGIYHQPWLVVSGSSSSRLERTFRPNCVSHRHKDLAAGRMADIISTEMLAWVASQYDAATGRFSWDRSERI